MNNRILLLKQRLLLRALDQVPGSELHAVIIREAELSWVLAARAGFADLTLPCLFEERVASALELEEKRRTAYWQRLAPPLRRLPANCPEL